MNNNLSDDELDSLLNAETFAQRPLTAWIEWLNVNRFAEVQCNASTPAPLQRLMMKRLLTHYNWKRYMDPSVKAFSPNETLLTFLSFHYPRIFATLLDVIEDVGMHVNGYGDRSYAAFWLVNGNTQHYLPDLQNTVLKCIDKTDDLLFKTCVVGSVSPVRHETLLGRLQAIVKYSEKWRPIFNHFLLRAYDDRSGIDMLSELTFGSCEANAALRLIETRQRQYQLLFPEILREALDNHAISCIGGVLKMIISFSWTYSAVTKYELLRCGEIQAF